MGDATKQEIIAIKSSKLVVRRCNVLEEIMAVMSCEKIIGIGNALHIASTNTKQDHSIIIVMGHKANMAITSDISTKLANTHTSIRINHHV